jgi:DNA polymerase III delta prime subunit
MINELIHYKKYYRLYFLLKNKNHSHFILSGIKDVGKTYFIKKLFENIYPGTLNKVNKEDYIVYYNNYYYYINCSTIGNKPNFLEYFKELIRTYDHYNNHYKYIILDSFEYMNQNIQNSLKVIIEKASFTSKIIIITNKINKIITPIKSRCINIRLPHNVYDNFIYFKSFFKKHKIIYNKYLLLEDCKRYPISYIINKYTTKNYSDINENIYFKIKDIIFLKKIDIHSIDKIRKISSMVKELNIDIQIYLRRFIKEYNKINIKIIKDITNNEYLLQKSYRELVHIENIILNLNDLINN